MDLEYQTFSIFKLGLNINYKKHISYITAGVYNLGLRN